MNFKAGNLSRLPIYLLFIAVFFSSSSCKILKHLGGGGNGGGNGGDKPEVTDQTPLNVPNEFNFEGVESGLYPWGNEMISNTYKTNYINICKEIKPLNNDGNADNNGKVVALGIGASNPSIMFDGLLAAQRGDSNFGDDFVFVNGAINAQDLFKILSPNSDYWTNVKTILSNSGYTEKSVQVIFCIEDNLKNKNLSIQRAHDLKQDYIDLHDLIRKRFPNCKLFLVGDRGYSGYTTEPKHAEPVGYLNGWGVKLFVEEYVNGNLPEYPFVNWLDYYWANGEENGPTGISYKMSDFKGPSYIHITQNKANELMSDTHSKLKTDVGAKYWYK